MKMGYIGILIIILISITLNAQEIQTESDLKDIILVEIKDMNITYQDLLNNISILPTYYKNYSLTKIGQRNMLETMIRENIFLKRAIEEEIDTREETIRGVYRGLRPVVTRLYFEELYANEVAIDAAVVERYYIENIDKFTSPQRTVIQHLQTNAEELSTVQNLIDSGTDFQQLIQTHSKNLVTALDNGIIRNIGSDGFISGIGHDMQLDRHIADAVENRASIQRSIFEEMVHTTDVHGPFETATGIHFFKIMSHIPEHITPFGEIKIEIEENLSNQTRAEFYQSLMARLYERYGVRVFSESFTKVFHQVQDREVFTIHPQNFEVLVVTGDHPELVMTLEDLSDLLRNLDLSIRVPFNTRGVRDVILRREIEARVLYLAAQEDNFPGLNHDNLHIQRVTADIIRNHLNRSVADTLHISMEKMLEYYEYNIEKFTTPAHRNILQFVATDRRTARANRRIIAPMLKRNEHGKIVTHIREHSLNTFEDGSIKSIRRGVVVPGIDAAYNAKIWSIKPAVLSNVFKNENDEYVFFYVHNEVDPRIDTFRQVESYINRTIRQQKIHAHFDTLLDELLVEYGVVRHYDRLTSQLTVDEMFALVAEAQERRSFFEALFYLNQIANEYPETTYAYEAHFMQAFIFANSIENAELAIIMFEDLLEKYPDHNLNETALDIIEALKNNTFYDHDIRTLNY
jgi:hypothetical protein